ncbi:MAG: hypothetical protein CXZ00_09060 [Acidobacteria bacterium]|nr:MAG: hypothetical protein CXZ00_09060 [Acidobacteriota bacterium]
MSDARTTFELGCQTPNTPIGVSQWCNAGGKRAIDLVLTIPALTVAGPAMLLIGACVKLSSGSPVLFRQRRFGKNGVEFDCLKFRTMTHKGGGPGITRAGDPRVTRIGKVLRKWKLDELPQLLNVLRGEMSLVGPRPDLPEFITELDTANRNALALLKPGITGWATLHFRNEEDLLASAPPEALRSFYVQNVLPRKIALDLEYASRATFFSDLMILVKTFAAILH